MNETIDAMRQKLIDIKEPESRKTHSQSDTLNYLHRRGESRPLNALAAILGSHVIAGWQMDLPQGQFFISFSYDHAGESMDLLTRYGEILSDDVAEVSRHMYNDLHTFPGKHKPPVEACYRALNYYFGDEDGAMEVFEFVIPAWEIDLLISPAEMEFLARRGLPGRGRDALALLREFALENGVSHTQDIVARMTKAA